ncbi:MAG: N-acetylmuramoyl-L-alanine amidase [Chloroflexi bacterium]|nr:MAG: N-acetylmuramoyl-L-alanine amidase [Chloroflexota bacterium]
MRKASMAGTFLALLILLIAIPVRSATTPLSGQKICLDTGHGGSALGAVNKDFSLEEKDINLDVAYGLRTLLEADGATVVMTRTDDSDKSNNDRYTFCNNESATVLVSVHTNSTTNSSTDGSLALYFHKDDKALAQAIYDEMYPVLSATAPEPRNFTDFGLDRFASGVLLKSDMPAAMMEPLFMSNSDEAALLTITMHVVNGEGVVVLDNGGNPTPNDGCVDCRRAQIAQAIHDGILNYFAQVGDGGDEGGGGPPCGSPPCRKGK